MPVIQALQTIEIDSLKQLIRGYVSHEKYQPGWEETESHVFFKLELIPLNTPYQKHFEPDELEVYQDIIKQGFSLAAYDGEQMIGLALAQPQPWNASLWIHEFHVLQAWQGKGIGRQLMETLAEKAHAANLRIMLCETQNTNLPAIRFYRKMGFRMEALDLSLYSNADYPDGEIALFMKRRL